MVFQRSGDSRIWLCFGFLSITVAVIVGYLSPATGYELSIYRSTPLLYWVALGVALLISVLLVFSGTNRSTRSLGAVLGGISMTTIMATPIIRGYHYMGTTDSLSHLGTTRDVNLGLIDPLEYRYNIPHLVGSILTDVVGSPIHHSLLIVVVVFVLCFFIFIPLAVKQITLNPQLAYVGLFSGFLLLPLNHLSPSTYIHPTSQAVMYAPVLVFSFVCVYRTKSKAQSLLFMLLATVFVMLHLQQAANLVLFFGTVAVLQLAHSLLHNRSTAVGGKQVFSVVVVFALVFWLWVQNIETFWTSIAQTVTVPFTDTPAAESTATRSVSLNEVGGSLLEVFLKLFSVQLLFAIFAGLLMIGVILRATSLSVLQPLQEAMTTETTTEQHLLLYFVGGFISVSGLFVVYLVGGISDQYFRHLGTIMVLTTILGSIAIGRGIQYLNNRNVLTARRTVPVLFILLLLATLPVAFASPYFYYPSDQVTEAQMSGYETTFANQNAAVAYDDVRSATYRYGNAIQGREIPEEGYYNGTDGSGDGVPDHFANQSLRDHYDQRTYVPVTEADRIRDPVLWQGFRFSHADFDYLDSEPGIHNVQSNGGYDLYVVVPVDEN